MADKEMTEEEMARLSDEELMSMAFPPGVPEEEPAADSADPGSASQEAAGDADVAGDDGDPDAGEGTQGGADEAADDDPDVAAGDSADPDGDTASGAGEAAKAGEDETADPEKDTAAGEGADSGKPKDGDAEKDTKAEDSAEIDYKAEYEKIMAPFKANGKEIKLNSPEEVKQLLQMGANYTKKLQALQPNLKMVKMLENNNLLDEGKLSYLIDLDKKDPKAVQKLLKESGLDPLDIDTSAESDYKPGNHRVSDEEMRFNTTLEEVASNSAGKTLIHDINKTWDSQSKEALWTDPDILKVLSDQKQNGLFDQITAEVERRRTLGYIGNAVPFIQAYKQVGEEMSSSGALQPREAATAKQDKPAPASRVLETRPAKSKAPSNNERARAASPTKSGPSKVAKDFNPLAMSDEDFEKHAEMANKV